MADFREQSACIKFCFNLGKTATECYEMLKTAFGEQTMGHSEPFQWFSRFKASRTSTDDYERSGRPVSSQIIREDRRRTINEVSMLLGISHGTCNNILTEDLKMRRVASKFVPRPLSVDQKQQRLDVCFDLKKKMPLTTPALFRMSLRVTKPGFTPTTWKPKLNPVKGKSGVTWTEEGKANEKQHQVNVDLFL